MMVLNTDVVDWRERSPAEAAIEAEHEEGVRDWCRQLDNVPLRHVACESFLDEVSDEQRTGYSRTHRADLKRRAIKLAKTNLWRFKSDF